MDRFGIHEFRSSLMLDFAVTWILLDSELEIWLRQHSESQSDVVCRRNLKAMSRFVGSKKNFLEQWWMKVFLHSNSFPFFLTWSTQEKISQMKVKSSWSHRRLPTGCREFPARLLQSSRLHYRAPKFHFLLDFRDVANILPPEISGIYITRWLVGASRMQAFDII